MQSDTYYQDMADNAIHTAYDLGYRPCSECGSWYQGRTMVITHDESGAEIHTCQACSLPKREESHE